MALTKEEAHISAEGVSFIKGAPTDVLDRLPEDYAFVNPGDYYVLTSDAAAIPRVAPPGVMPARVQHQR